MSSVPGVQGESKPFHKHNEITEESTAVKNIIDTLKLIKHVEGGYFAEIDRNPLTIPNPFLERQSPSEAGAQTADKPIAGDNSIRNASTSIYYLLTPTMPQGHFHRNKGRTIHTIIEGRGQYVLIHADEASEARNVRIESFVVGKDVAKGEKAVWIVEGGKYKASFLLPLNAEASKSREDRLLISETVIPGFEYADHDFLTWDKFEALVTTEQAEELWWLVRKE